MVFVFTLRLQEQTALGIDPHEEEAAPFPMSIKYPTQFGSQ